MNTRILSNKSTVFCGVVMLVGLVGCGGETSSAAETPSPTPITTQTPTPVLEIGSTMISASDGMKLVYVPEGEFKMGSEGKISNESPVHTVFLDAFWIDETEITNAMFSLFVSSTNHQTIAEINGRSQVFQDDGWSQVSGADWAHPFGPDSNLDGLDLYPVVHVGWEDANTYCAWAGRRLPTEAEWEKAARGTNGRIYPWGDDIGSNNANFDSLLNGISEVGHFPDGVSPYGALDMAGNAWEFTADWFDENYYQNTPLENPTGPEFGSVRVVRGGSWSSGAEIIRSTYRGQHPPKDPFSHIGFRCALSVQPE